MTDELGNSVSVESVKAYRALFSNPPKYTRTLVLLGLFALLGWLAYLTHETYQARMCYDVKGAWSNGVCKPPTIEVKYYNVTVAPDDAPPAPAPPNTDKGTNL